MELVPLGDLSALAKVGIESNWTYCKLVVTKDHSLLAVRNKYIKKLSYFQTQVMDIRYPSSGRLEKARTGVYWERKCYPKRSG